MSWSEGLEVVGASGGKFDYLRSFGHNQNFGIPDIHYRSLSRSEDLILKTLVENG